MEWLILFVPVIGILLFRAKKRSTVQVVPKEFPYKYRKTLFTPAERSFYGVLCRATVDEATVFGKVRVADILTPVGGLDRGNRQSAFNRISAEHFDFVLCRPDDLSVLSVIELDDNSHSQKKQIDRDWLLEGACNASGLMLHRFKVSSNYNINEVREKLFHQPRLESEPIIVDNYPYRLAPAKELDEGEDKKICPKCASKLIKKIARKGKHKGSKFIACSTFPKCRYIVKLEAQQNN